MTNQSSLDDLVAKFDVAAFRSTLTEAYHRGVNDERERVLRMISGDAAPSLTHLQPKPTNIEDAVPGAHDIDEKYLSEVRLEIEPDSEEDGTKRAPRGLTREVVFMILEDKPDGLSIDEVQRRAVDFDERVSAKTVYNELNRERGKLYRSYLGKWYLESPGGKSSQPDVEEAV